MYKRIDHIVVRVKNLEEGLKDYEGKMGLKRREEPHEIPELGMKRAVLPIGDDGSLLEICEPLGEGAVTNAFAKYGEGLHLVALAVDDLQTAKQAVSDAYLVPRAGHSEAPHTRGRLAV